MKRLYVFIAVSTVVMSGILSGMVGATTSAALPRDCDNNSIIHCGAISSDELTQRFNENKTGDLPAIYQSYGLSAEDMTHADSTAKMGEVHKDGSVVVNGEIVATNATSIGRQNIFSGSTPKTIAGKTFYDSTAGSSFAKDSIAAYVFFDDKGVFKSFVLTSCGNPGTGKPKPKPTYTCNALTAVRIGRTEYSFEANASASGGATIVGYTYEFGDDQKTTSNATSVKHTYTNDGTYMAKLTVTVKVGSGEKTVTDATRCVVKVVVTPEECKPGIPVGDVRCSPCEIPGKEQYPKNSPECVKPPVELPRTGPMDMIGGGFGIGSAIAATYYWRASRKDLLSKLLGK